LVVYLCTDAAGNINGRDFIVGGSEISLCSIPDKERTIYRDGGWDLDSLEAVFPAAIGNSLRNPMPAQPPKS
ncbi:MAG: 3-oxoacyl-ACP reductase, partial [Dehalococcoidia bacterium]